MGEENDGQIQLLTTEAEGLHRKIEDLLGAGPVLDGLATYDPSDLLSHLHTLEDRVKSPQPPVLRSVHHFACTGGTLISRCIGAMPNTQVLSEIDPLSPLARTGNFTPADLISLARSSSRPTTRTEDLIEIFRAGLRTLFNQNQSRGIRLVLRDHSHSYFCTGPLPTNRPTLYEILEHHYRVLSLITVRHPLDSFQSLKANNWEHFSPFTMEEYAKRYDAFLDRHRESDLFYYEEFIADPDGLMQDICKLLCLPFNPDFHDLFSTVSLSGDSGRKGDVIAERPRRPVSEALAAEIEQSASYLALCRRLGYDPSPDGSPHPTPPAPPRARKSIAARAES